MTTSNRHPATPDTSLSIQPRRALAFLALALAMALGTLAAPSVVPAATARPAVAAGSTCAPSIVDDFATGEYRYSGLVTGSEDHSTVGDMLGGRRKTRLHVGRNPYRLPSAMVVAPDGKPLLTVASGYRAPTDLTVLYGSRTRLRADLSCYGRFQLHFVAADLPLNINVEVKSDSSPSVYQCGLNTEAPLADGSVAEFPFDCFVTNDPDQPKLDWTHIDRVLLLVQSASGTAANDYAIGAFDLAS